MLVHVLAAGDFTLVCTTELGKMAAYAPEFEQRGVKLLGLSCDDVESHKAWIEDMEALTVSYSALSLHQLDPFYYLAYMYLQVLY